MRHLDLTTEEEEEHAEPKRPRDTDNKRKRIPTDVDRSLVSTKKQAVAIDREVRCPFLLRVFVRVNRPLRIAEFDDARRLPEDELQVYTWPDATLSELATLVMEVEPSPRRRRANLRFATVYRPQTGGGKPMLRDLGKITVGQTGPDDLRSLQDTPFKIGDLLAVSVTLPR
eukprot:m.194241 g.194241  ORF g.194241 m.194241 type:complete len:171 (-) comp24998_c0_seq2:369-881(-)